MIPPSTFEKTKLFITFVKKEDYNQTIEEIISKYDVHFKNIFVFENSENQNEYILSYSINCDNISSLPPYTMAVHRKGKNENGENVNVMYTLNGLNFLKNLIGKEQVDWSDYKNSIILVSPEKSLRVIETKIFKIIKTQ